MKRVCCIILEQRNGLNDKVEINFRFCLKMLGFGMNHNKSETDPPRLFARLFGFACDDSDEEEVCGGCVAAVAAAVPATKKGFKVPQAVF